MLAKLKHFLGGMGFQEFLVNVEKRWVKVLNEERKRVEYFYWREKSGWVY